jgi:ribosome-binding factor A
MPRDDFQSNSGTNTRPLRVGEAIRHALADIFMRGECHMPELAHSGISITVSEVRVSPDLKNATAYVMPLAGEHKEELIKALKEATPELRYLVSKKVDLRYMPRIHFTLDNSFDEAQRINNLLKNPEVARDLEKDRNPEE